MCDRYVAICYSFPAHSTWCKSGKKPLANVLGMNEGPMQKLKQFGEKKN